MAFAIHRALEVRPVTLLNLFEDIRCYQEPLHLEWLLQVCEADAKGRKGLEDKAYPQAEFVWQAFEATRSISGAALLDQGVPQKAIPQRLKQERVLAIKALKAL